MMLTVACDIWIVSIRHASGDLGDLKVLVSVLVKNVNEGLNHTRRLIAVDILLESLDWRYLSLLGFDVVDRRLSVIGFLLRESFFVDIRIFRSRSHLVVNL
jgi:hypothetical protein